MHISSNSSFIFHLSDHFIVTYVTTSRVLFRSSDLLNLYFKRKQQRRRRRKTDSVVTCFGFPNLLPSLSHSQDTPKPPPSPPPPPPRPALPPSPNSLRTSGCAGHVPPFRSAERQNVDRTFSLEKTQGSLCQLSSYPTRTTTPGQVRTARQLACLTCVSRLTAATMTRDRWGCY